MERNVLSGEEGERADWTRACAGVAVRVPLPRCPVRELVHSCGRHPFASDRDSRSVSRCGCAWNGEQHLFPDRSRDARRPCGQERDLDRRVRQRRG